MKRSLLWLMLLGTIHLSVVAQEKNFCGAQLSQEQKVWLKNFQKKPESFRLDEIQYVPVQVHNIGTSDGKMHFAITSVLQMICDLNKNYAPLNIQFFLNDNDIIKVNNSTFYQHTFGDTFDMMQSGVNNAVNIFVVDDPAGNCGYYSPWGDGVSVAQSCSATGSSTLTHELGHYFSMPHTFNGWEDHTPSDPPSSWTIENVARSGPNANCNDAGDGFCDTPADFISARWNCPYNQNYEDPTGEPYQPDGGLFMSYSNDACQTYFSNQQIQAIKANLNQERNYLLNSNQVLQFDDLIASALYYPANTDSSAATSIKLQWKEVPTANRYNLYVYAPAIGYKLDILTDNTSYNLSGLAPNTKYYWKVAVYNDGNFCPLNSSTNFFYTTSASPLQLSNLNIDEIACKGGTGAITLNIGGGTAPYTYTWNGEAGTNTKNGLTAGVYQVQVTDSEGNTQLFKINLDEPETLQANVSRDSNSKNHRVEISGGTPPYVIQWSNGATAKETEYNFTGNQSVTIADAKGCTYDVAFKVIDAQNITVNQVLCAGNAEGSISLQNIQGGTEPYTIQWSTGSTDSGIENLTAGTYSVSVQDSENTKVDYHFTISEPAPLQVNVQYNESNNQLTADINGGVAPYQVFWSNGVMGNPVTLPAGEYIASVLDANGCGYSSESVLISGFADNNMATCIKVAPSTLQRGEILHLNACNGNQTFEQMRVLNTLGNVVYEQKNIAVGANFALTIPAVWSSGLYVIQFSNKNILQSVKIMVK